jgi:hypothetical protein
MRKTLGVCLLVLLLTCSASAGIIPNDTPAPPPPSQPTTSAVQEPADDAQNPTVAGEMPNFGTDGLTQAALDLLALLPSLV